ncbi:hypothetical protein B0O99DRAFT_621499 [Bisporella sp. PMI_857]|nr:hypothetical protein B0O99DRAFT_621499 [Bisporella sp. PMI_857]
MNSTFVCLPCRRKIAQVGFRRSAQRASFISIINVPNATKNDPLGFLEASSGGDNDGSPIPPLEPSRLKRQMPRSSHDPGDQLEAFFEETVNKSAQRLATTPSITSLAPYQYAQTLKTMVADDGCSATDAWDFFIKHFGPETRKPGAMNQTSSPSYIFTRNGSFSGRALMRKIMLAKSDNLKSGTSITEISLIYSQLGVLHGKDWADMMNTFLNVIYKQNIQDENLFDVLGSWNVITRQNIESVPQTIQDSTPLDWSHITTVPDQVIGANCRRHGMKGAFIHLSPAFPVRQREDIPLVAVATFALLIRAGGSILEHAKPLMIAIAQVINSPDFNIDLIFKPSSPVGASILSHVKDDWHKIKNEAANFSTLSLQPSSHKYTGRRPATMKHVVHHSRLEDAVHRKDLSQIDRMWSDASVLPIHISSPGIHTAEPVPQGSLSAGMCNHFIQAFMAVRAPSKAIDVWNHMIHNGLAPNLATWNSMLTGCKISRNTSALEDVWGKLVVQGVKPDVHCWTSRVGCLVEGRKPNEALKALDEMGQSWLKAARDQYGSDAKAIDLQHVGDISGIVKPAIETVNAALVGLLRRNRQEDANRILAWAGNFGINPDNTTYNTLLRPIIRDGQVHEAMALLKHMKADGVEADVGTFTTILDEILRYSDGQNPEEQRETIANIFEEMAEAGIKANLHTYGTIVYQLLQHDNNDFVAVNAVLARMTKEGLKPSQYIYTIFINYYFRQKPPNVDAVRALIKQVLSEDEGAVDNIFWDRVITGYARIGDTATAMRILGQVSSKSSWKTGVMGWRTLDLLVTALIKNDEWDVARTLVKNVAMDTGGPIAPDVHGKDGQHKFWVLAESLGLLTS